MATTKPRAVTNGIRNTIDHATTTELVNGARWYQEAAFLAAELAHTYHTDYRACCGILAALSPMVGWAQNVADAHTILSRSTRKVATYGKNRAKAEQIRDGADPNSVLGGSKVRSFYANIRSGGRDVCVTIDRHAIEVWSSGAKVTDPTYRAASRAYGIVGKRLGLTGAQTQAIAWVTHRRIKGVGAHHG